MIIPSQNFLERWFSITNFVYVGVFCYFKNFTQPDEIKSLSLIPGNEGLMATCSVIIIKSGAMKNGKFLSCKKHCKSPFKKCITNNNFQETSFSVPQSVYRTKHSGYIISQIHVYRKIYVLFSTRTCTRIYIQFNNLVTFCAYFCRIIQNNFQ